MEFIEAKSIASINYLDPEVATENYVKYTFNETVRVWYNNTEAQYLIYHSRFTATTLLELYVDNGTEVIQLEEDVDFSMDEREYIIFYYEDYFQQGPIFNFTIYLLWEHIIGFVDWRINQMENNYMMVDQVEQIITGEFNYEFQMLAQTYGLSIDDTLPTGFWYVALTISPLDKEQFNDHELMLRGVEKDIGDFLNPDGSISIEVSDEFSPESSHFSLNFTADYVIKFEDTVGDFWAVDRLVDGRSIRERIFLCHLLSGPRHLYLKNIIFHESTIFFEEEIDSYSLFERLVEVDELNSSISGYEGLNVTLPYLYVGETCPVSIKYMTFQKLKIVITDDIKMPLVGAKIEIFQFGVVYGTYISNSTSQPINPQPSDENGQIIVYNVPRGNYSIRVYWRGNFVKEAQVSTFNEVNYVYTSIPHSPLWIIIFGSIIGTILLIGAIFYQKYKNLR
jgi:hypothetical protein